MTQSSHAVVDSRMTRVPPLLVGLSMALCIAIIAIARWTGVSESFVSSASSVEKHRLYFEDRVDGSIAVTLTLDESALSSTPISVARIAPESNGFLRGVLRGLASERKRRGMGSERPFELNLRADGRLTLDDPGTGRQIDLRSFGPTNAATFESLLADARKSSRAASTGTLSLIATRTQATSSASQHPSNER